MTASATTRSGPTVGQILWTCLASGQLAGLAVWFLVFPAVGAFSEHLPARWVSDGGFGLSASVLGVAGVLAAMAAAVRWRFRGARLPVGTVSRLAASLVVAAIAATPPLTLFAAHEGYATRATVLLAEIVIGAGVVCMCVTLTLRTSGVRQS